MDITTFNLSNPWRTGRSWEVPGIQRIVLEGAVAAHAFRSRLVSQRINYRRTKSGAEVDIVISDVKPDHVIEVNSGFLKRITISRGLRSFLSKYKLERAILLNNNLWQRETEDCVVEALPTANFLLGPLSNSSSFKIGRGKTNWGLVTTGAR